MAKQPAAAGMPSKPEASSMHSANGEGDAAAFSNLGVHGDVEAFRKFMCEHMSSILRRSKQSSGDGANDEDEQIDSSEFEVCCAGLEPVLEAVEELPLGGTPIPASAQKRVEEFLVKQINSGPAAVSSSSGPAAKPPCVRPKELQDTKQLREFLQLLVKTAWGSVASTGLTPVVTAAVQLVAEAAHRVARQQVIEKKSQAYTILLDEGYRAGVMAQSCAAVKAVLGLRILKPSQLARAIVVSQLTSATTVQSSIVTRTFDVPGALRSAWKHLGKYHSSGGGGSSGSAPPWAGMNSWLVLVRFGEVASSCCNVASKHQSIEVTTGMGTEELGELATGSCAECTIPGEGPRVGLAFIAGATGSGSKGSSSGSGEKAAAVAASGKRIASPSRNSSGSSTAASSCSSGGGSAAAAAPNLRYPCSGPGVDLNLPLDDCPLLSAHCRGFGPLLNAVAAWQAPAGTTVSGGCMYAPLRPAIKQYVLAQFDAYTSGSPKPEQLGGPRRRSIVPLYHMPGTYQLQDLADRLHAGIVCVFRVRAAAQPAQRVPSLVAAAVKEVVKEQAIEKSSPAFDVVIQSGAVAGFVAVAVGVLQQHLGIVLRTEQQLFAAFRTCCDQLTAAMPATPDMTQHTLDSAVERSVAFNVFQALHRIASSSSTSTTGDSSSGCSGSGSSSSSKPLAFAMPKCGLNAALMAIDDFVACNVRMVQCEGVYTRADALESSPWVNLFKAGTAAKMAEMLTASPESAMLMATAAVMAAAYQDSAAPPKADPDWGKWQGLAGLKGLFKKPAAADAAAGAKSVAVKASGSEVVVASSTAAKAPAAAPAAGGNKGSAASNTPSAAVANKAVSAAVAPADPGGKGSATRNAPAAAVGKGSVGSNAPAAAARGKAAASTAAAPAGAGGKGSVGSNEAAAAAAAAAVGKAASTAAAPAGAGGKGSVGSNEAAAAAGGKGTDFINMLGPAGGKSAASTAAAPAGAGGASTGGAQGAGSSSTMGATPPELLVEANLKDWYCSPTTLDIDVVQPLPEDSLQLLVKLKLHTTYRNHGWNALHYACASRRVVLARQLLEAGAHVCEPEDNLFLQPLHIACIGHLSSSDEFFELLDCKKMADLAAFIGSNNETAELLLVQLLLEHGADPDAAAGAQSAGSDVFDLQGLRPVHILCWWVGGEGSRVRSLVFNNPFLGKAISLSCEHRKTPLSPAVMLSLACDDFSLAECGSMAIQPSGKLGTLTERDAVYTTQWDEKAEAECQAGLAWNEGLQHSLQHAAAAQALIHHGAQPDVQAGLLSETPLLLAAAVGNAALAVLLLEAGADPDFERRDGARALEVAADAGYPMVGWALLCYGAQAVPQWKISGRPRRPLLLPDASPALTHEMLVANAIQCQAHPWNIRFLERLLADGAEIEHVWPETGETPLLMAICYSDAEMVQLLLMAGADVNACLKPPGRHVPAVAHLLHNGRAAYSKDTDKIEADKEILQMLLDAGADLDSWRSEDTEYDLVQTAANMGDLDAALKLVEAGCKWQLPKGQRSIDGSIFYAPEILKCHVPNLKLNHVEGRFRIAEKLGRRKRAATATALQAWLAPTTTTECKEATLKCLVAAGVTPGQPCSKPTPRSPVPAPRGSARWKTQGIAEPKPALQPSGGLAASVSEQDTERMQAVVKLLLEEDNAAEAAAPSKAGSKKKKKETAAQKEAKKKERQRAALLEQKRQQKEQQSGSGSDSEAEQDSSSSGSRGAAADAASTTAEAGAEGFVTQAVMGADGNMILSMEHLERAANMPDTHPSVPQQQQQHLVVKDKLHKGKKGKAAQQQQQAQVSSSDVSRPGAAKQARALEEAAVGQQRPATPPAAAAPPSPPKALQAAPQATAQPAASASTAGAAAEAAALRTAQAPASVVLPPAATRVASTAGQGAPAAPGSAAVAAPVVIAAAAPQAAPAPAPVLARPAFLPPHLRMSMPVATPAAAAADSAAISGGAAVAGAAVGGVAQQPAVVPQPVLQGSHQQQQGQGPPVLHQAAPLRQRMVELAQQHQLQQQHVRHSAPIPQQQHAAQQGGHTAQQQHRVKGSGPPLPGLPSAMMALLSGSTQHNAAAAAAGHAGQAAAGDTSAAAPAAHRSAGAKRQAPAAAPKTAQAAVKHPQQHQQAHLHPQHKPAAAAPVAAPGAAGKGTADTAVAGPAAAGGAAAVGKGPRLCVVCSQRRRNVLLMPCNHMVLCEPCADRLHGQGKLSSCPHCSKPVKQRIRVHQS